MRIKVTVPRSRPKLKKIVRLLCCLTAFCTTYALILPAITTEASSYCGYEEHKHTEDCYEEKLICDIEENHVHDESCYDENGDLICDIEENHVHTQQCHRTLLTCGKEEHDHTLQCFSNPEADVETQDQWEKTLPENLENDIRENALLISKSQNNYKESESNFQVQLSKQVAGWTRFGAWDNNPYEDWSAAFVQYVLDYAGLYVDMNSADKKIYKNTDIDVWYETLTDNDLILDPTDEENAKDIQPGDILFVQSTDKTQIETEDATEISDDAQYISVDAKKAGIITEVDLEKNTVTAIMGDWNKKTDTVEFLLSSDKVLGILPLPAEDEETEKDETSAEENAEDGTDDEMESSSTSTSTASSSEDTQTNIFETISQAIVSTIQDVFNIDGSDQETKENEITNTNSDKEQEITEDGEEKEENKENADSTIDETDIETEDETDPDTEEDDEVKDDESKAEDEDKDAEDKEKASEDKSNSDAESDEDEDEDAQNKAETSKDKSDEDSEDINNTEDSDEGTEDKEDDLESNSEEAEDEPEADEDESDKEQEEEGSPVTQTVDASDGARVKATYEEGVLPEDAKLKVRKVEQDTEDYLNLEQKIREEAGNEIDEDAEITIQAYDIEFYTMDPYLEEETKVEPNGNVSITLILPTDLTSVLDAENTKLYHLSDEGELNDLTDQEETVFQDNENKQLETVEFSNDEFSIYANATYINTSSYTTYVSTPQELYNAIDNQTEKKIKLKNSIFCKSNTANRYVINKDQYIYIDLNGYTIEREGADDSDSHEGLFYVCDGGHLYLTNSQTITETNAGSDDHAGYYHMSSSSGKDGTTNQYFFYNNHDDTLKKVSGVGLVNAKSGSAIYVQYGGHLTLEKVAVLSSSGTTTDLYSTASGYRAIKTHPYGSGTAYITMNNAYVIGAAGGINITNTSLTMSGGAIANNTTGSDEPCGGGIAAFNSTIVLQKGAEITHNRTGNEVNYGGGIYMDGGSLTLNDCWVSYNKTNGANSRGGGIAAVGDAEITMNGSTGSGTLISTSSSSESGTSYSAGAVVSYNESTAGGGGIWLGPLYSSKQADSESAYAKVVKFIMNGGLIDHNKTQVNEGGGLCIATYSYARAILYGGTISNNSVTNIGNWGGGGIFCGEYSYLIMPNGASIYGNDANGYGGGFASCSTGKVIIGSTVAMFDNTAVGTARTSEGSKQIDRDLISKNQAAINATGGGKDYFGAYVSQVSTQMPNGSSAMWKGAGDTFQITNPTGDYVYANDALFLTCGQSETIKNSTSNKNKDLIITGNHSDVHGGGVMVNGYMIGGMAKVLKIGDSLNITADKSFTDLSGVSQTFDANNPFTFEIRANSENGTVVGYGKTDSTGKITFDTLYVNSSGSSNTFTYYINEVAGSDGTIMYDGTIYKVVLTISKTTKTESYLNKIYLPAGSSEWYSLTESTYTISSATVSKKAPGETTYTTLGSSDISFTKSTNRSSTTNYKEASLKIMRSGSAFSNKKITERAIVVDKSWSDGNDLHQDTSIDCTLIGKVTDSAGNEITYSSQSFILNENHDGNWSKTFQHLPVTDEDGRTISYSVVENTTNDLYSVTYDYVDQVVAGTNQTITIWVPVDQASNNLNSSSSYILVDPAGDYALKATNSVDSSDYKYTLSSSNTRDDVTSLGQKTYSGTTYRNVIENSSVDSAAIIKVNGSFEYGWDNSKKYSALYFPNKSSNYLGTEANNNSGLVLGTGNYIANSGTRLITLDGTKLIGHDSNNKEYVIGYANNSFISAQSTDSTTSANAKANPAVLYEQISVVDDSTVSGAVTTVTITNSKTSDQLLKFNLNLKKVSSENSNQYLAGAVFSIHKDSVDVSGMRFSLDEDDGQYFPDEDGIYDELTTDSYGSINIKNLKIGTYYLIEEDAPYGYKLLEEPVSVTFVAGTNVDDLSQSIEISNEYEPVVLPGTGGTGKDIVIKTGASVMAISGIGLLLNSRHRKKKRHKRKHRKH